MFDISLAVSKCEYIRHVGGLASGQMRGFLTTQLARIRTLAVSPLTRPVCGTLFCHSQAVIENANPDVEFDKEGSTAIWEEDLDGVC